MKKRNIVIATLKSWNVKNAFKFKKRFVNGYRVFIFQEKDELCFSVLKKINPEYVFLPHWSWMVPENIFSNFKCVVFHMTDLPFGRGGSPLQNLILRGIGKTKISAVLVNKDIDAGAVFMKKNLTLSGSAQQIYKRASSIIFNSMMPSIIQNKPDPIKQKGKIVKFRRRTPGQSLVPADVNLKKVYDFIRMLDAEGYPRAFIEIQGLRFEFDNAVYSPGQIKARIFITRKDIK